MRDICMVKKWVFQRESNNKYSCITNAFSSKHAQGTIEYLVMMAVIVVVGLVVVGLVANQTDSFQGVSSSTSKLSSSLGVISVNEAVVDGDGNGLISFSNNSGDLLIITKLSVEGIDFNYPSTNLFQGKKKFLV